MNSINNKFKLKKSINITSGTKFSKLIKNILTDLKTDLSEKKKNIDIQVTDITKTINEYKINNSKNLKDKYSQIIENIKNIEEDYNIYTDNIDKIKLDNTLLNQLKNILESYKKFINNEKAKIKTTNFKNKNNKNNLSNQLKSNEGDYSRYNRLLKRIEMDFKKNKEEKMNQLNNFYENKIKELNEQIKNIITKILNEFNEFNNYLKTEFEKITKNLNTKNLNIKNLNTTSIENNIQKMNNVKKYIEELEKFIIENQNKFIELNKLYDFSSYNNENINQILTNYDNTIKKINEKINTYSSNRNNLKKSIENKIKIEYDEIITLINQVNKEIAGCLNKIEKNIQEIQNKKSIVNKYNVNKSIKELTTSKSTNVNTKIKNITKKLNEMKKIINSNQEEIVSV